MNEPLAPASVNGLGPNSSTEIRQSGASFPGVGRLSEDGLWVVLKSTSTFQNSGTLRSFLYAETSGQTNSIVTDLFGNPITANAARSNRDCFRFDISASNVAAPDTTTPTVTRMSPANGATNVSRSSPIVVQFSEAMDPSSARLINNPITITVTNLGNGQAIAGTISFADDLRSLSFSPAQVIPTNTNVQISILNGAGTGNELTDLAGNPLSAATFSFTTGMNQFAISSLSQNTGDLIGGDTVIVQGDGFSSSASVTIDGSPCKNVSYLNQSQLSVTVPAGQSFGAKDVVVTNSPGVTTTLSGGYTYRNQGVGKQAPEIFFEFPPANSNGNSTIAANSKMILVFSEPMDVSANSISYNNTLVPQSGFNNTTGTLSFALNNRIVVLDPNGNFNNSNASLDVYRFRNSTGGAIKDTGGQRLDNILLGDIRFFIGDPDEGITYRWSVGAADNTPPSITSQSPTGGSTHSVRPPIRLSFSEVIDPVTVQSSFQVTDSTGVVPGTIEFDLETLTSFVFTPSRDLTGASATVDASSVEDLGGNSNPSNTFTFNLGNDTIPPVIQLLTVNDIPAHLNGTDSRAPGTLFLTDTGFTIDIDFQDDGGSGLPINASAISITANVNVGNASSGTNLVPFFPTANIFLTASEAHFLVPEQLNFQTGVTVTLSVTVQDNAGNTSAVSTFQFVCGEKTPQSLPFETVETWFLTFDRDFDSFNYDFNNYRLDEVSNDNVASNGIADFDEELLGLGLRSTAGATAFVSGSTTLTVNQAARNWIINRTLFYMAESYGHAVDFSEVGSANPGFSEIREYSRANTGPGGARVRFVFATGDPGENFSRIGLGGLKAGTAIGVASFDTENFARNHDNGVNGAQSDLGVFTGSFMNGVYDGNRADSDSLLLFRTVFDPLSPFKANPTDQGTIGVPLGNDANDAVVLSPTANPATFTTAQAERYRVILRAMDSAARLNVGICAHEVGHSVGLVADGAPNGSAGISGDSGLHGGNNNLGSNTSGHIEVSSFFPANGQNLMAPSGGLEEALSPFTRFNRLNEAYLRNKIIVADSSKP